MGGCCTSMKEAELAHAHDFALAVSMLPFPAHALSSSPFQRQLLHLVAQVKKKHAEDELLRIKNAHDKGMGLVLPSLAIRAQSSQTLHWVY